MMKEGMFNVQWSMVNAQCSMLKGKKGGQELGIGD